MAAPINLEVGLSASSGAAGNAGAGDFIVTSDGGLLPAVSTDKAWIVWLGLGLLAILAINIFRK